MHTVRNRLHDRIYIKNSLARELMAEFFGTMLLIIMGDGCVAPFVFSDFGRGNSWLHVNLGWALAVMFAVYACGGVSGGHINPAISVAMWFLGNLDLKRMLLYSVVQVCGAFVGATVVFATYFDAIDKFDGGNRAVSGATATAGIFATYPLAYITVRTAIIDQLVGTGLLAVVVLSVVDERNKIHTSVRPLLIGLGVGMIGICFGQNIGYPINPARDFGPRLLTLCVGYGWEVISFNNYTYFWIPIVGPILGALLGAWLYKLFIGLHWPRNDGVTIYKHQEETHLVTAT